MTAFDPRLPLTADKDVSRTIYTFVCDHLGADHASFSGDFDLPIQIVTSHRLRGLLNGWFNDADLNTPEFGDEEEDSEDEA